MSYNLKLNDTSKNGTFATNKSAILKYTDSLGTTGEEAFEVPRVKYIVSETTTIEDKTSGKGPKTGDMNDLAELMVLLFLSSIGALVAYKLNKHSKDAK